MEAFELAARERADKMDLFCGIVEDMQVAAEGQVIREIEAFIDRELEEAEDDLGGISPYNSALRYVFSYHYGFLDEAYFEGMGSEDWEFSETWQDAIGDGCAQEYVDRYIWVNIDDLLDAFDYDDLEIQWMIDHMIADGGSYPVVHYSAADADDIAAAFFKGVYANAM